MLPDQETFPTQDEAGKLHRELFVTNSKLMELINQQTEFDAQERKGMEVGRPVTQTNLRIESSLRNTMFAQILILSLIAVGQYFIMRRFSRKLSLF